MANATSFDLVDLGSIPSGVLLFLNLKCYKYYYTLSRKVQMECKNNKCDNNHDGSFGSGLYCSRSCSNTRQISKETKTKISNSLKGKPSTRRKVIYTHICEKCGDDFNGYVRKDRKKYCSECKRKVVKVKDDASNILELSKRTITKILKRSNVGCAICGWNESTNDIHHIVNRSHGGSDNNDNLIIVCPNHHRIIHTNKTYSNEYLFNLSIDKTFKDWKKYYNV